MFDKFKAKAEGVSAEVFRFVSRESALEFIQKFFQQEEVSDAPGSYAVWADSPFRSGINREKLLKMPGVKLDVTRELAAASKVGVSEMEWGIADTGTLVQDSFLAEQRLVSSLPLIHIALLPTKNIQPDLATLLLKVHPSKAGYIAMITGASRTADIERVLTIGVHGPERLIIVCIDELGGV